MKITLVTIGKTDQDFVREGLSVYMQRLKHYVSFGLVEIPALKKPMPPGLVKQQEAKLLQKYFTRADCIVLLDEKGKQYSSIDFSGFLQKRMNAGIRELLFVVGGAWGFDPGVYKQAHHKLSLSSMTFSHQMIRVFFVEQLYRAFTILKGESYHNP